MRGGGGGGGSHCQKPSNLKSVMLRMPSRMPKNHRLRPPASRFALQRKPGTTKQVSKARRPILQLL